jgi:predicted DNA-binding protein (MmcQ/YjbR family)
LIPARRAVDDAWMQANTAAAALIDRVRRIALALDGASEKLSHGEPTFFVRGRTFAMIDDHHHGADHLAVYVNAPEGAQRSLVDADGEHFFVPPYVGKAGWIGVRIDRSLPWEVIGDLLRQAHAMTGIKKKSRRRAL